ncbi:hypothetical protein [Bhargavaea ginsengi]|uniref:hypothetical protein n=1 Tax=Bhargavaea ginsengi TaxID=426757 RepID=UPI003C795FE8
MIFRVSKKESYVVLDKGFLNNRELSWQAKGLLAYMLSLPNDWQFNVTDLKNRSRNGRDSTKAVIRELEEQGYIQKEQKRDGGKFSGVKFIVLESPLTGNPLTDNPLTENPSLLSNKELSNKRTNNADKAGDDIPERFERIWKQYPNKKGKANALKTFKKLVKEGVNDDDIIKGIQSYVRYCQANRTDKQYMKHGSTFFNERAWEDDWSIDSQIPQAMPVASGGPQYRRYQPDYSVGENW